MARFIVGLTGGIGSGKSSAEHFFAALGVPVIDADAVARELVRPGQAALRSIVDHFGAAVVDDHGVLRRACLRQIIFADASQRRVLESILHPQIRAKMQQFVQQTPGPYHLFSIPLLLETGQTQQVDRIAVVDLPLSLQYERIKRRDGYSDDEIAAIIKTQVSREERLRAADDIIVNDGSMDDLKAQVRALHDDYCERSRSV